MASHWPSALLDTANQNKYDMVMVKKRNVHVKRTALKKGVKPPALALAD